MSEYTSGPWDAKEWTVFYNVEVGRPIGVICYTGTNAKTRTDENKANAKLIAAAPDLLEACQAIIKGWDAADGEMWIPDHCNEGIEAARSAIAKATGQ